MWDIFILLFLHETNVTTRSDGRLKRKSVSVPRELDPFFNHNKYLLARAYCYCGCERLRGMDTYVSKRVWIISGMVPSRRHLSSSMRLARQSSSRAVLICWTMVLSMRLHELNAIRSSLKRHRTSSICAAVEFDKSGRTGRIGWSKGTPVEMPW
jgi:hypothetical protein